MAFADVTSDATQIFSNASSWSHELYKAGNLRYVRVSAGGATMSLGWNNLIRVADAHRPQKVMYGYGVYPIGTLRDVRIATDGYVQIWADANTSKDLRVFFTYMV